MMHQISEKAGKKRSEQNLLGPILDFKFLSACDGRNVELNSSQPRGNVEEERPTAKVVADTADAGADAEAATEQLVVVR